MEIALNEIKIQAKKLLKTLRADGESLPALHRTLKRLTLTTLDLSLIHI